MNNIKITNILTAAEIFFDSYFDCNQPLVIMSAGECEKEAIFLKHLMEYRMAPNLVFIIDPLYKCKEFLEKAEKNIASNFPVGRCRFLNSITEVTKTCDFMVAFNYQLAWTFGEPFLEEQRNCLVKIKHKFSFRTVN